jgi:preprotein translocase subunit SecY
MRSTEPPRLATWLIEHTGRDRTSLAGDLLEEYRRGRSTAWYWKQVLTTLARDVAMEALIVVGLIVLYRVAMLLTIPGADARALAAFAQHSSESTFARYDGLTGGNLSTVTVLALGVVPFVTASIIVQLSALLWWLTRNRRASYWKLPIVTATWVVAVALALIQSAGVAMFLERQNLAAGVRFVSSPGWGFRLSAMLVITAGSVLLMWIGDRITARNIGNGFFLVFFAAVMAGLLGKAVPAQESFALQRVVIPLAVAGIVSSCYRRAFERRLASI